MASPAHLETVAVHAGARAPKSLGVPLVPPVELSAVGYFDDASALDRSLDGEDFVYSRIRSRTVEQLEEAVASLEGAEACAAFASGMAALRATFEAQALEPGDCVVVPGDGYGASLALYKSIAAARGLKLHPVALAEPAAPERIAALKPKFILAESVTNPLLSVPDLPALARAAKAVGASLAVDGTFSSPALQRVLEQGADYAIQSTTKWLNGHSDAMGGTVSGSAERIGPLRAARVLSGPVLGPFEAWLTLRGLRTLPLRMRAHSANAAHLAERLAREPRLSRVLYPGLPSHPHHAVAGRLLRGGAGGMISFEIAGAGRAQVFRLLESLKLCRPAPSLGDVATLVMHPATASARRMTSEERAAAGIGENLVRVSVGLEHPDDVADDLLNALDAALGA